MEEQIRRRNDAKNLLENPLLREALAATETEILSQMRQVSTRDAEMHTKLILALRVRDAVVRYLQKVINDGDVAANTLKLKENKWWK